MEETTLTGMIAAEGERERLSENDLAVRGAKCGKRKVNVGENIWKKRELWV